MSKPFTELSCDNMPAISNEIYRYLETQTDLLTKIEYGWHFVDCKKLLQHSQHLVEFFKNHKLAPRHAAITIVADDSHLPLHTDELPVVAKINMPVINTQGWANRWYIDGVLVGEVLDLDKPIVFNSQIAHSVEKTTATQLPRIIASFTFHNEPLDLLK
jgi:hypothetical protein